MLLELRYNNAYCELSGVVWYPEMRPGGEVVLVRAGGTTHVVWVASEQEEQSDVTAADVCHTIAKLYRDNMRRSEPGTIISQVDISNMAHQIAQSRLQSSKWQEKREEVIRPIDPPPVVDDFASSRLTIDDGLDTATIADALDLD